MTPAAPFSPHTGGDDTLEYWVYAHPATGSSFLAAIVENTDHATIALQPGRYTFTVMTVAHNTSSDHSAESNMVRVTE